MTKKIRVLIVDDSVVIRRLLKTVIAGDPGFEVIGTATNGREGVELALELKPDAITMDVEMPELDGIGTLRELQKHRVPAPVVMFSTLTESGAATTVEALSLGASDYVTKPSNTGSMGLAIERVRGELLPKLKALCGPRPTGQRRAPSKPTERSAPAASKFEVVAIGSSTGGPAALTEVLQSLPGDLQVPVVITQHMPKLFTKQLADRLDQKSRLHVVEARDGEPLRAGTAYVAPGDYHLTFKRAANGATVKLSTAPPENFCRPAVDVMYRSLADLFGGDILAVMLTGMGHDGRDSTRSLRDRGAHVIAQDEATSVVWGMPGAVVEAGLADEIHPITEIAPAIVAALGNGAAGSRRTSAAARPGVTTARSTAERATPTGTPRPAPRPPIPRRANPLRSTARGRTTPPRPRPASSAPASSARRAAPPGTTGRSAGAPSRPAPPSSRRGSTSDRATTDLSAWRRERPDPAS